MSEVDKELYKFQSDGTDPEEFMEGVSKSLRMNVLKESEDEIDRTRNTFNWYKSIHYIVKYILLFIVLRRILRYFSIKYL